MPTVSILPTFLPSAPLLTPGFAIRMIRSIFLSAPHSAKPTYLPFFYVINIAVLSVIITQMIGQILPIPPESVDYPPIVLQMCKMVGLYFISPCIFAFSHNTLPFQLITQLVSSFRNKETLLVPIIIIFVVQQFLKLFISDQLHPLLEREYLLNGRQYGFLSLCSKDQPLLFDCT